MGKIIDLSKNELKELKVDLELKILRIQASEDMEIINKFLPYFEQKIKYVKNLIKEKNKKLSLN